MGHLPGLCGTPCLQCSYICFSWRGTTWSWIGLGSQTESCLGWDHSRPGTQKLASSEALLLVPRPPAFCTKTPATFSTMLPCSPASLIFQ